MKIQLKSSQRLLLALSCVVLLSVGWFGVSGLSLLVAFVPLLLISASYDDSRKSWWRMAGWCSLIMAVWCVATCWWIYYASPVGVIAATVVQVVLFGGVFMVYHYFSKRARSVHAYTTLIAGWLWAEHLYLHGEISFPWLVLGNGFANDVWAVQWYEFTGALGGSLWVLLANVLLFELVLNHRRRGLQIASGVVVVLPLIVSLIVGASFSEDKSAQRATVTVAQPNFDPYEEKFTTPLEEQLAIMTSLVEEAPEDVDYIVFPETVVGDMGQTIHKDNYLQTKAVSAFEKVRSERYPEAQLILGAMTSQYYPQGAKPTETARKYGNAWVDRYNSAIALDRDSVYKVRHKSRLVIGVEKMPYMSLLKPLESLIVDLGGTTGQLGTDKYYRNFLLRNSRFPYGLSSSAPICYESVYGDHFAAFAEGGAEILMVITNDGWWHDTPGYRQHFSYSRLRAIETRRWVCRSANTGISGFISPKGEVTQSLGWDQRGTLTQEVTPSREVTFYAKMGDYVGRLGTYMWILSLLYYVSYRFRRRNHLLNQE